MRYGVGDKVTFIMTGEIVEVRKDGDVVKYVVEDAMPFYKRAVGTLENLSEVKE